MFGLKCFDLCANMLPGETSVCTLWLFQVLGEMLKDVIQNAMDVLSERGDQMQIRGERDRRRVHRGGKEGGGQMRKGVHCWGASAPSICLMGWIDLRVWPTFGPLYLWLMPLLTVGCRIVPNLIYRQKTHLLWDQQGYSHHLTLTVLSDGFQLSRWK